MADAVKPPAAPGKGTVVKGDGEFQIEDTNRQELSSRSFKRKSKPNPLSAHVQDSFDRGVVKVIKVTDDENRKRALNYARQAANSLDAKLSYRNVGDTVEIRVSARE